MTHVFFCAAPVRGYFAALPACSESGGQSPVTGKCPQYDITREGCSRAVLTGTRAISIFNLHLEMPVF